MFNIFNKFFSKRSENIKTPTSASKGLTREMIYAFRDGIKLSDEREYEMALNKFDMAIEAQIFKEAYRERGYCLQILGFHLDAIDDFSKAIEYFPANANNYYGRGLSNARMGFFENAISDLAKSVELSKIDSEENRELSQIASEKKVMPPTLLYQSFLDEVVQRTEEKDPRIKAIYISPPKRRN